MANIVAPSPLSEVPKATAAEAEKWIADNGDWVRLMIEKHKKYLADEGIEAYQAAYDGFLESIEEREKQRGDEVNHKVQANYAQVVIDTVVDYILGNPMAWEVYDQGGDGDEAADQATLDAYRKDILALIRTEEGSRVLAEQLRQGSIGGYSPIISWIDEDGKIDYDEFPIQEVIPVYNARGRLQMVLRHYEQTEISGGLEITRKRVEIYDRRYRTDYLSDETGSSFSLITTEGENPIQHKAGRIPVSIFINGQAARYEKRQQRAGVSDLGNGVQSLLEEYASAISDKANTVDRLLDQYLLLTNVDTDEGEVMKMRRARALQLKNKESSASFIAPSQDDVAVENYLDRIKDAIHEITFTPKLADLTGATATEIKVKYAQLDIKSGKKEIYFTAAIKQLLAVLTDLLNAQRLAENGVDEDQIYDILSGEAKTSVKLYNSDWVVFTFNRNIPQNFLELAQIVATLSGIVPDEYLYPLLWFIEDPEEAIKAMKKQKEEAMKENPLFQGNGEFTQTTKPDNGGTEE